VTTFLETQLWLWLDACEEGKPMPGAVVSPGAQDKVVPFLQYGVREGDEADERVRRRFGLSSKLQ